MYSLEDGHIPIKSLKIEVRVCTYIVSKQLPKIGEGIRTRHNVHKKKRTKSRSGKIQLPLHMCISCDIPKNLDAFLKGVPIWLAIFMAPE